MASLLPTAWQASASATALIECICCLLCVARMAKALACCAVMRPQHGFLPVAECVSTARWLGPSARTMIALSPVVTLRLKLLKPLRLPVPKIDPVTMAPEIVRWFYR